MVIIPYNTDAPMYHFPWGTIGLAVANLVCFIIQGGQPGSFEENPWTMHFGTINPVEWLSNIFAHATWGHLIGNLYFLGLFGMIVEGKLGWKRFIPLYLALGIGESAISQILMFGADSGGALGASGAIMGLMAICMVWAPKNDLSIFVLILLWPAFFEVTIMFFALFYLFWDLLALVLLGFRMSSQALHLTGAILGFAAGVYYVKKEWVDCENWDLMSVMKGTHGRFGDASTTVGSHADAAHVFGREVNMDEFSGPEREDSERYKRRVAKESVLEVNGLIDSGQYMEASERLLHVRLRDSDANPDRKRLKRLATGLHDANAFDEAQMFLEEYVDRYPEQSDSVLIRLAAIELHQRKRPSACLRTLKRVRLSQLTQDQQRRAKSTVSDAKKQVRAGVQDAVDELDWDEDVPV